VAASHPFELTGDVLDPERSVQPRLVNDLPCHLPTAANLAREKKALLADTLGKLADCIAEGSQRLNAHVFGGVDAEAVDIGKGDPETIGDHKTRQCRGNFPGLSLLLGPEIQGAQAEHVALKVLRAVVPVGDVPFAQEHAKVLKLQGNPY